MIEEIRKRISLKLKGKIDFEVSELSVDATEIYLVTFFGQVNVFGFLPYSIKIRVSSDHSYSYFYMMGSQIWNF